MINEKIMSEFKKYLIQELNNLELNNLEPNFLNENSCFEDIFKAVLKINNTKLTMDLKNDPLNLNSIYSTYFKNEHCLFSKFLLNFFHEPKSCDDKYFLLSIFFYSIYNSSDNNEFNSFIAKTINKNILLSKMNIASESILSEFAILNKSVKNDNTSNSPYDRLIYFINNFELPDNGRGFYTSVFKANKDKKNDFLLHASALAYDLDVYKFGQKSNSIFYNLFDFSKLKLKIELDILDEFRKKDPTIKYFMNNFSLDSDDFTNNLIVIMFFYDFYFGYVQNIFSTFKFNYDKIINDEPFLFGILDNASINDLYKIDLFIRDVSDIALMKSFKTELDSRYPKDGSIKLQFPLPNNSVNHLELKSCLTKFLNSNLLYVGINSNINTYFHIENMKIMCENKKIDQFTYIFFKIFIYNFSYMHNDLAFQTNVYKYLNENVTHVVEKNIALYSNMIKYLALLSALIKINSSVPLMDINKFDQNSASKNLTTEIKNHSYQNYFQYRLLQQMLSSEDSIYKFIFIDSYLSLPSEIIYSYLLPQIGNISIHQTSSYYKF